MVTSLIVGGVWFAVNGIQDHEKWKDPIQWMEDPRNVSLEMPDGSATYLHGKWAGEYAAALSARGWWHALSKSSGRDDPDARAWMEDELLARFKSYVGHAMLAEKHRSRFYEYLRSLKG